MKVTELFPGKWLKADDLEGRPQLVTIESVKLEPVEEGKPPKPVLMFRGMTQGLILNKTNGQAIAAFLGEEADQWVGKKIVIFPTQAGFQGKMVACIRVRQPKQSAQPAPELPRPSKLAADTSAPATAEVADEVPF
jgi:hypothetical protein